jgi:hypothetical protein
MADLSELTANLAYVIGVALGDGNLSSPNGRVTRLRVTCSKQYPELIETVSRAIQDLLPENRVSLVDRPKSCVDISCYSNKWERWLGWSASRGSKYTQGVSVPDWIKRDRMYTIACLRGLIQTDGAIYNDRGYKMVNFVSIIPQLAGDVLEMIEMLGFKPHMYKFNMGGKIKHTIRLSKNVQEFIRTIDLVKR